MASKIKNVTSLSKILARARSNGKEAVFTNGCFDIIHAGHVDYLIKAKSLGDILVVGINSDSSVRAIKGKSRPINNEKARAKVLASLYFVDYVVIFSELTPERLIKKLKPNILVKGGDWKAKDIVGNGFVKSIGGRVVSLPFLKGFSTTEIIRKCGKFSG